MFPGINQTSLPTSFVSISDQMSPEKPGLNSRKVSDLRLRHGDNLSSHQKLERRRVTT